mgnify:CR=1 FL=1|tara:strand:- start:1109 stop:1546 length:438 start_codon:yes stop_codon:yes gene_type:complete
MPNDSFMKLANTLHRALIKVTAGKRGWDFYGMPVIKLTTVGRVSGKDRSVMLTSPIKSNGDICLVASKGGDDRHPEWYLNLLEDPRVTVEAPSGIRTMFATILEGDERESLWNQIVVDFPNYGAYQEKTNREIPIIVLKDHPGTN